MTKDEFYNLWPMNEMMGQAKEQHLVVKLRDSGFSWAQIDTVFYHMDQGTYSRYWNIKKLEEAYS